MAKKKTESAVVVTRAEKKDATKNLIRELLTKDSYKHNDLIEEVARSYAQRFEGEETENINDVKGRVGSVLDIMKKDGDILLDGGMYALKQEIPAPVEEKKPAKKAAKKAEPKKKQTTKKEPEEKQEEPTIAEEKPVKKTTAKRTKAAKKAEETEEKTAPLPTPPIQPVVPVAPITPETAPEPIPEPAPKKRTKRAKKETVEEVKPVETANEPPMVELKEEKTVEKEAEVPTVSEVKVEEPKEQALTVKEKGEITPKNVVMDMSFLFGDVKPKTQETKTVEKQEKSAPVSEKTEQPKAEEKPVEKQAKPQEKPLEKQEERKPERINERKGKPVVKNTEAPRPNTPAQNVSQTAQNTKKPLRVQGRSLSVRNRSENKPMTEEEKLRDSFLRRLRALGGDYFEYYSVYLLEKYSRRNGRRLEGLRVSGGEHDGGIDGEIELTDKFGFRETIYIQSKNWDPDKGDEKLWVVGETLLQQFIGACMCRQAKDGKQHTRGIFITTSRFTPEAKRLLDQMSDTIIGYDGAELFETAKECGFGLINKNGTWQLDEQLLSGTKAFFNML